MKRLILMLLLIVLTTAPAWAQSPDPSAKSTTIYLKRSSHLKLNLVLTGALWTTTALDIHSSNRLDSTRFPEANIMGGTASQIASSAAATGVAFLIDRYAKPRWRWVGSLLLGGAATAHGVAAIHNYRLQ
jgi:hypothetical protein